jgi:hypothetical protein
MPKASLCGTGLDQVFGRVICLFELSEGFRAGRIEPGENLGIVRVGRLLKIGRDLC